MAPDIALDAVRLLPKRSVVLDPMVGSGTVIRAAINHGHTAIGFDLDPLATLMSKVWTTPLSTDRLRNSARALVFEAVGQRTSECPLAWIDDDSETASFVKYWFAQKQKASLRKLAFFLRPKRGPIANALRLALSRIIVTKSRGASLAGDVSHSRPHRIRDQNNFLVFDEFLKAAEQLADNLESDPPKRAATVSHGDARNLESIRGSNIDAVITSPPYLNAIDYLRGHRLALVWLGHRLKTLREIRGGSIGAERGVDNEGCSTQLIPDLISSLDHLDELPSRQKNMLRRYALDVFKLMKETKRVLRDRGTAVYVIGNSCLRGVYIENTRIVLKAAEMLGLELISQRVRKLPPSKRYLPPPSALEQSSFSTRMRTEAVLTFRKTLVKGKSSKRAARDG